MILSTTLEIIFSKDLYVSTVGKSSPLFGGAAEGKAKALQKDGQFEKAFEAQKKKKIRWTFERSSGPGRSNNTFFMCFFQRFWNVEKCIYYNICSITRWTPRTLQMSKYFCKNDWTCWSRGLDLLDMTWCTVRNCSAQPIFRNHMFKVQKVYNCKKTLYVSCCFVSLYIRLWKKHSVSMPDVILYTLLLCVLTLCAPWWKRWTTEDYDDAWSHRTFNSESLYFLIMGI